MKSVANKEWRKNRQEAIRKAWLEAEKEIRHYRYLYRLLCGKRKVQEYQLKDCPRKCCK